MGRAMGVHCRAVDDRCVAPLWSRVVKLPTHSVTERLLGLSGLLMLSLVAGCTGVVAAPATEVRGVEVVHVTEHGTEADVIVALRNDNDVPLPLALVDYQVTLGGRTVEASTTPDATVPAEGEQIVRLRAAVPDAPGDQYRVRGRFQYVPPGEIRTLLTDFGVPLPTTGFEASGNVTHPEPVGRAARADR